MQTDHTTRRQFLGTSLCTAGLFAAVPLFGQAASPQADRAIEFIRAVEAGDLPRVQSMLDAEPALASACDQVSNHVRDVLLSADIPVS